MKKIIFILVILFTTIYGGCMYPKFEHNIEDQYTITQNNKVGAEYRGDVAIGGSNPLRWSTIPEDFGDGKSRATLKEVIEYAVANGHDTVHNRNSMNIDETHFDVDSSLIIEASDGEDWVINITDFEKARYNYADITVGAVGGCLKSDASDQYSPACANADDLYYLKADGTFATLTRANISGKTYLAVDDASITGWGAGYEEFSLVNNGGTYELYRGGISISSGITSIDTTNPKLIALVDTPYGGMGSMSILMKSSSSGTIRFYGAGGQSDITIKDPNGNTFSAMTNWYSNSLGRYVVDLATGISNGIYISYLYKTYGIETYDNTTAYQDSNWIKTINAKLLTVFLSGNSSIGYNHYIGGSQIWYFDDTTWTLQLSITFEPDNAKFLQAGNMLYFIAGNTTTGRLEIWKKSLNNTSSTWILVRRYFNKSMLYLTHYYDSSTFGLRILFKNIVDNKLYYFINKTITLTNRGQLNGLIINNNASFYDLGQDEFGNDIFTTPVINGTTTGGLITYCSLYANDLNILNWTWMVQNSILKSNKNGLYYKGSSSPAYEEEFKNNLILCGGWAVKIEKSTGTPSFSNAIFKNNTIKSVNGMSLCIISSLTVKNNIIDCSYTAFDINSTTNTLTVSNSIVNGQVDEQVTLSNCLEATNPLFKDIYNDDYTLMSKAEGYPKDSKAIKYGDDGKDAGCYDVTRTNNGETLKETFELTNFVAEIMRAWEYPKKETGFDYRGNFLKTMSNGTRLIKLSEQNGLDLDKVDYLEYLIGKDEVMRFYPNGTDGLKYIIDYSTVDTRTWKNSATLTLNFTTMTATAPANHKFQRGYLKGAWLIVAIPPSTTQWYYITDNSETVLYLENKEAFTPPASTTYTCTIKWYYVKTPDTIDYQNGIWEEINQQGIIPSLTLYVVESKEV